MAQILSFTRNLGRPEDCGRIGHRCCLHLMRARLCSPRDGDDCENDYKDDCELNDEEDH